MPQGIRSLDELHAVTDAYLEFDEFGFDVETFGPHRGDPRRNEVFWISLAGPGRADVIPCGHPVGERIPPDGETARFHPKTHRYEARSYAKSKRGAWVKADEPFTPAPKQLWVSDVMSALKPLLFSERRKIGSGIKFDLESVTKYFGEVPPPPYGDIWIAARLIDENWRGHGLKECADREFGVKYQKIGKEVEKYPYSEAYEYSYLDAKYTWLLWNRFIPMLDRENLRHIFDLEMDLLPVLVDMEMTGAHIDLGRLNGLHDEFEMEMARLQLAIDEVAGFAVNLNANRQVAKVVYDVLEHPCTIMTPSGERSTSKEALEKFPKDKIIAKMLEHASLRKLQGTFVNGLLESQLEGRIHPDFNQMGAVSGRLSCRNPNLQNQPSRSETGKKIRSIFVPTPGYSLMVIDLSQIELRMLAHFTQDKRLLQAYEEGLDLHAITAKVVFGDNFTDIERSYAKNGNFSVVFGAGPMTLVVKYKVKNLKTAKQILQGFYNTYRKVKPWKDTVIYEARDRFKRGKTPPYVMTILGRKRRLPALLWLNDSLRFAAERQAVSVTISGSAADLFKVIMVNCHTALKEQGFGARMLITVHDELVIEAPTEHAEEVLQLVKSTMEMVVNPFTGEPFLSVPIVADAKLVSNWSEK